MSILGISAAATGLGTGIASLFGNKTSTGSVSKLTAGQRQALNIMLEQAMGRLGSWTTVPKTATNPGGKMFVYNPKAPPEYPLPRQAGLTGLQKQSTQGAWDLGNYQNQLMSQKPFNFAQALADYKPGNLQGVANSFGSMPAMTSTPYQFNQYALSGGQPARPALPDTTQYLTKSINTNPPYIPALARGGSPTPNAPNLVGEQGPELFKGMSGRENMVGETGPEMLRPQEPGNIIPNNQLPPMMQQGRGPQQEMPGEESGGMPGASGGSDPQSMLNMIAMALIGPTMSLAGQGRSSGGTVAPEYQQQANLQQQAQYSNKSGSQQDNPWGMSTNQDNQLNSIWGLMGGTGNASDAYKSWQSQPGANNVVTMGNNSTQDPNSMSRGWNGTDWSGQNSGGTVGWTDPNREQNNANAWASGNNNPGGSVNSIGTSPGQWGPVSNNPAPTDWSATKMQYPTWVAAQAANPATGTGTGTGTPPPPANWTGKEWGGFTPQPQQTGADWFAQQYPDVWKGMQNAITNPQQAYQFDPAAYNQQFNSMVYDPAMQSWQDYTAPYLKEQFANTGNVFGNEMPQYLTQQAGDLARNLESERFQGIQTGQQQEQTAKQNMLNNQLQAISTSMNLANTPFNAQNTQAQTTATLAKLPSEIQQNLANVNLTNASAQSVLDKLSSNPLVSDKMKADTLLTIAQGQTEGANNLRTQIQTIGDAYNNWIKAQAIGGAEATKAETAFENAYNDWINAIGPSNTQSAESILMSLLGISATEPYVTQQQSGNMDLSGISALLALGA